MIDSVPIASAAVRLLARSECENAETPRQVTELERAARSALQYLQAYPRPEITGQEVGHPQCWSNRA